jgi:hypothetical protein
MGKKKKKGLVEVLNRITRDQLGHAERVVAVLQVRASELAPQRVIIQIGRAADDAGEVDLAVGLAGLVADDLLISQAGQTTRGHHSFDHANQRDERKNEQNDLHVEVDRT